MNKNVEKKFFSLHISCFIINLIIKAPEPEEAEEDIPIFGLKKRQR